MDYQEKLRLAKEALNSSSYDKRTIEYIFPELKENKDERIRNFLISKMKEVGNVWKEYSSKDIIAWLEKQGEQKPQGKPALEVWKDMRLEVYQQASGNRHEPNYSDDSTKMFSLTDIDEIFEKVAEKQGEQKANEIHPIFRVGDYIKNKNTSDEVVIEQLDVELKVYYYTSYDGAAIIHSDFPFSKQDEWELIGQKIVEQKSAWSEEDEKHYQGCLHVMNLVLNAKPYPYYNDYLWLKSIKDRILPQPKSTWSEEDKSHIGRIINYLESFKAYNAPHIEPIKNEIDWLKSLKENMKGE
jgi:hypothetical protein